MHITSLKLFFAVLFVPVISFAAVTEGSAVYGTLKIDKSISKKVSPVKYGFHYEEIGMMGEGALHAEMVRNRTFEEATPPAGIAVKDGLFQDVPAPKGKNKQIYQIDPLVGWMTFPVTYSPIKISLTKENPLNRYNVHSMLVEVTDDMSSSEDARIVNVGYYGMNLKKGHGYDLSFFARNISFSSGLTVFLTDAYGNRISGEYEISLNGKEWEKHALTLVPDADAERGMLAMRPESKGRFQIDVVSMMPQDTWDSGKSVFRSDIMTNLKEYAPDFIRFPGGCIVHGINGETMYKWKKTIGPVENRPGQWSKWTPNYRTDGIGYHEFYELCEYLGADAMYVISTGMICTGWVPQTSPWNFRQPEVNLDWYIQDALDAIEYAIGGVDTKWGAERAKNGHPEPFPLKYIEIGNEDFGPVYWERYEKMYQTLHDKYPELIYIANSIIGKENNDKIKDIKNFVNPENVKVFDEHHYQPVEWACNGHYRFDAYPRGEFDLFIGELGIDGKYPANLLAAGAFRMSLERNGDLNPLMAERPVMRHWDFIRHRNINPMLLNGVDCSVKTSMFYLSKMFRDNKINVYYDSCIEGFDGMQKVFVTMGRDSESGEYVFKVINLSYDALALETDVKGFRKRVRANKCILRLDGGLNNSPDAPQSVAPEYSEAVLDLASGFEVEPMSFAVYRFR